MRGTSLRRPAIVAAPNSTTRNAAPEQDMLWSQKRKGKQMNKLVLTCVAVSVAMLVAASPALAVPMTVFSDDTPAQDPLHPHFQVHELGNTPLFPVDEWITSGFNPTEYRPCFENEDHPQIPNMLVNITNQTNQDWYKLVYVSDPETTLTNDDGFVNGELAFNIDNFGANKPLIFESLIPDNVFQAGETWEFVIQDYSNFLFLPPSLFGTIGVGGGSAFDQGSTGSIIAVVPEPATMSLLALGGLAALKRRRRK